MLTNKQLAEALNSAALAEQPAKVKLTGPDGTAKEYHVQSADGGVIVASAGSSSQG